MPGTFGSPWRVIRPLVPGENPIGTTTAHRVSGPDADGHHGADELATVASLHDRGVPSDEEFERAKAGVLT